MSLTPTQRTLSEWLDYIESVHPSEIEMGLSRVRTVAERMGLMTAMAERTVITIAGTNGKGSCVASLEALFAEHPQKPSFAAYTSPHFLHFNERIRLNGEPAQDEAISQAFAEIDSARDDISLSYFEFATLAALKVFADAGSDYVILEVGLGGRLDAVNIIDADIAIVTSIALDHQDWLGSDLQQIGREKAGIFRGGRVAISASPDVPSSVEEVARELGAKHWQANQHFDYQVNAGRVKMQLNEREFEMTKPGLPVPSVVAAVLSVELLGMWPGDERVARAFDHIQLTGRCQRINWLGRELILDVAHNPAASEHLQTQLFEESDKPPFLVLGAMADKDLPGILKPWATCVKRAYACDLPNTPRAATAKLLYSELAEVGIPAAEAGTVRQAMEDLRESSQEGDRIIIMGSFFTVAAALSYLDDSSKSPDGNP
ncbi:bifunctional folylpolyglutamate synthase/dihydrofolate synthase [Pseudoteredinibacter isoporae]|uniref:Dihydrofolate synthase/folylpolyglutamate synthase n=1 Tax=Pseudoteredinibacter isoporae TaxID=570281 RepID=A0A7X0JW90_9GAMM|nr:folylpolyglutamate synthase/dihydrofolate synthase family protein [Pseudoteredinibacter isoporae]MBB6523357.1 dihydrofolate synthase/folylpolyglutamate synthase [Pseudoteredinibacter isoporae]NHO88870.1 bifunctional folylpolyglutamate synthase/dihydrofolate synthase [Pseudoteredinibacter isoporae]NIB24422.1 bifunctional folylpolyglutamate synthase/dihydrofolate synthase [Pseudoteredinibacter isoporae]